MQDGWPFLCILLLSLYLYFVFKYIIICSGLGRPWPNPGPALLALGQADPRSGPAKGGPARLVDSVITDPAIHLLQKSVYSMVTKVHGSNQSRIQLHSQIWSTCLKKNPPSLWITF